jgi:Calcineurin-like phosphoesterase
MARQKSWKRSDTFTLVGILLALASTVAAVLVVPEFRRWIGLDNEIPASDGAASTTAAEALSPLPKGAWRFGISGDSRNCGDVIMPAIAASLSKYSPSFYWHLGDLRAIYKIDEDMAFAAGNNGQELACADYHNRAWNDFIENQIKPFGHTPFYVGIGNHEVIQPKTEDEFKQQFAYWLDQTNLREQRLKDNELAQPESYYHWIQGGVDFVYLDNAASTFSPEELTWLQRRLAAARRDSAIRSVVVGMHEALPDSIANFHSMGDRGPESPGYETGKQAYIYLKDFRDQTRKPVYILASHSHFYMENIFDTPKLKENGARPLPGWIVGTAGAVRYALPGQPAPSAGAAPDALPIDPRPNAITDVYGYLLGTVASDGTIRFSFQPVRESDVPQQVRQHYTNVLIPWCFAENSWNRDRVPKDRTPRCVAPQSGTAAHDSH